MGKMKKFLMDVSEEMGFHGEINDEVVNEAQERLANLIDFSAESKILLDIEQKPSNEKQNLSTGKS